MDNQLEEIKAKVDLVELIQNYLPLKKAGHNFKGLCPFHGEKTPSFMVSPERQIFKCFGCNEGGDVFGFLMKIEGLTFGEALRELADRAGIKLKSYQPTDEDKRRQLYFEINHLAAEFYHYLLLNHQAGKKALNYILGRGITHDSLLRFKLGFAPTGWDNVQKFLIGKKKYQPVDLETVGLVSRSSQGRYFDRFRGRLIFPLKDVRGQVCGFAGRLIPGLDGEATSREEAKYVNTSETPVYHKSNLLFGWSEAVTEIKKADAAILVEGELDMISSYQAGVKNTLAIKGSALTENQLRLIGRVTQNLILALDADVAGDLAARRGIEIADTLGFNVRVVLVQDGKDPDEAAQKNPVGWNHQVKKAIPVYDYLLDSAIKRFGVTTAEGKRRVGQEFLTVIKKMTDPIVQAHYIHRLAQAISVNEEILSRQLAPMPRLTSLSSPTTLSRPRREVLEEHLLALSIQGHRPLSPELQSLITTPIYCSLLAKKDENSLPAELKDAYDRLFLIDVENLLEDEELFDKDWQAVLRQLRMFDLSQHLAEIEERLKQITDQEQAGVLEKEFRDLSTRLAELQKE